MNDSTRLSDPNIDLSEQTVDGAASTPEQRSDGSPDAEEREFVPRNSYSDIYWPWPQDWDGFEEFVKKSREESSKCREAPPWW